jgi:cell division protein FtsQ
MRSSFSAGCSCRTSTCRSNLFRGERCRVTARRRAAVIALPRKPQRRVGVLPSRRSVFVGLGLLALGGGVYVVARTTSAFAIRSIVVTGGPPDVTAQVRRALAPVLGTSLLALDGGALERRADALPAVVSTRYDRAFPHTLRVTIVPEVGVAVVHRGTETWLVSARGRVIARIAPRTRALMPRIWVPAATPVQAGVFLSPALGGDAAPALALAQGFPVRIATATLVRGQLAFQLRSGVELRLGEPNDVRLKLAVARRALPLLPGGTTYLDVSQPDRPVAGANSQVSSGG